MQIEVGKIRVAQLTNYDLWLMAMDTTKDFDPSRRSLDFLPVSIVQNIVDIEDDPYLYCMSDPHLLARLAANFGTDTLVTFQPATISHRELDALVKTALYLWNKYELANVAAFTAQCLSSIFYEEFYPSSDSPYQPGSIEYFAALYKTEYSDDIQPLNDIDENSDEYQSIIKGTNPHNTFPLIRRSPNN